MMTLLLQDQGSIPRSRSPLEKLRLFKTKMAFSGVAIFKPRPRLSPKNWTACPANSLFPSAVSVLGQRPAQPPRRRWPYADGALRNVSRVVHGL